jgi:hypothetical protein
MTNDHRLGVAELLQQTIQISYFTSNGSYTTSLRLGPTTMPS